MKDLGWVQKNLIPHLIDYTIECNYYSEGDFGSLYAITFESSQKGGYIHFWGSGWFGVDVYDYEKDEESAGSSIIFGYGRQPGCMRKLIHRDKGI